MKSTILLLLISSAMHFLYDFIPNPILSLIVPINESIFQHIKILFYPILFYFLYYKRWNTFLFVQTVSILSMLLIYYFYRYAFNIESVPVDILLITIIFYFVPYLDNLALQHHWITNDVIAFTFLFVVLFLLGYFTLRPLSFPIFIEGNPVS